MVRKTYKCNICSHVWEQRKDGVKKCPNCFCDQIRIVKIGEKVPLLTCAKCNWEWRPRIPNPRLCPQCRTAYWQKETRDEHGQIVHGGI